MHGLTDYLLHMFIDLLVCLQNFSPHNICNYKLLSRVFISVVPLSLVGNSLSSVVQSLGDHSVGNLSWYCKLLSRVFTSIVPLSAHWLVIVFPLWCKVWLIIMSVISHGIPNY